MAYFLRTELFESWFFSSFFVSNLNCPLHHLMYIVHCTLHTVHLFRYIDSIRYGLLSRMEKCKEERAVNNIEKAKHRKVILNEIRYLKTIQLDFWRNSNVVFFFINRWTKKLSNLFWCSLKIQGLNINEILLRPVSSTTPWWCTRMLMLHCSVSLSPSWSPLHSWFYRYIYLSRIHMLTGKPGLLNYSLKLQNIFLN